MEAVICAAWITNKTAPSQLGFQRTTNSKSSATHSTSRCAKLQDKNTSLTTDREADLAGSTHRLDADCMLEERGFFFPPSFLKRVVSCKILNLLLMRISICPSSWIMAHSACSVSFYYPPNFKSSDLCPSRGAKPSYKVLSESPEIYRNVPDILRRGLSHGVWN